MNNNINKHSLYDKLNTKYLTTTRLANTLDQKISYLVKLKYPVTKAFAYTEESQVLDNQSFTNRTLHRKNQILG